MNAASTVDRIASTSSSVASGVIDTQAPPERLAVFRILVGVFVVGYLLVRLPVFLELADRSTSDFDGVGIFSSFGSPLPAGVVVAVIALTIVTGALFTGGAWFRVSGPLFALGTLVLVSYRSSWGQLLHFEHLPALHLLVLAWSPAADAFSVDSRRRARPLRPGASYGWPLSLCALLTVVTYVIAGIAKLRYGGVDWIVGDTLRNHVAYSAARLDVLGADPSPLAQPAVRLAWALPLAAAASVVIELGAPVALLRGRVRTGWVAAAWTMHATIFALMFVGFPYPLFLVAFAPLFDLDVAAAHVRRVAARRVGRPEP